MPLDLAVGEAYFKGSLIDRVTSLERRLLQVYTITSTNLTGFLPCYCD